MHRKSGKHGACNACGRGPYSSSNTPDRLRVLRPRVGVHYCGEQRNYKQFFGCESDG